MQITKTTEKNDDMIKNAHDSKIAKHQNILKTLKKIQKNHMEKRQSGCKKNIKNCPIYVIGKHDRSHKKSFHQFLPPPETFFQKPALDFVSGLPESQNLTTGIYYDMF